MTPPSFWRINYLDGDYDLVLPPSILDNRHRRSADVVMRHLEIFLEEVRARGIPVFPYSAEFHSEFDAYFHRLGKLLITDRRTHVDPKLMTPESRQEFFVCTEPVRHPQDESIIPGLSGLQQLLGFSYQTITHQETSPEIRTTGNVGHDVMVDAILLLKGNATKLCRQFAWFELSEINAQANYRLTPKDQHSTEPSKANDDTFFTANKAVILEKLKFLGVSVPAVF